MVSIKKVLLMSEDRKLLSSLKIWLESWGYDVSPDLSGNGVVPGILRVSPDVIIMDLSVPGKFDIRICDEIKTDLSTAYIPIIVLIDRPRLRKELLKLRQGVDDYLISPADPLELRTRIEMALKRARHSFYANPLTGLPGGVTIENALKERIESGKKFVAGHIDIDNFKSFNDRYGYVRGDRVIMQTAYMLNGALKRWGTRGDFIGHIGGDDFVIITTPEKYNTVCRNFVCMFDTITLFHYSPEDRKAGYIKCRDRNNSVKKIPLMSVTVALVMEDGSGEIPGLIELNERIAEVKQYLKKIPGSKYMADRRVKKKNDHLKVSVFTNDDAITTLYKPLGQILVEQNAITPEQLDKALGIHWKRRELLGQVLKDMGIVSEEKLDDALSCQERGLDNLVRKG